MTNPNESRISGTHDQGGSELQIDGRVITQLESILGTDQDLLKIASVMATSIEPISPKFIAEIAEVTKEQVREFISLFQNDAELLQAGSESTEDTCFTEKATQAFKEKYPDLCQKTSLRLSQMGDESLEELFSMMSPD